MVKKAKILRLLEKIDNTTYIKIKEAVADGLDVTRRGECGETGLHLLGSPQNAESMRYTIPLAYLLTDAGLDINAQDDFGNSVLHVCVVNEAPLELILTLLRLGADMKLCNKDNIAVSELLACDNFGGVFDAYNPGLVEAVDSGDLKQVKFLMDHWFHADVKHNGKHLHKIAKSLGHLELASYIKAKKKQSAFVHAVLAGNTDQVKKYISDSDINICEEAECSHKWPLIALALYNGYTDVVNVMLSHEADVNLMVSTLETDRPFYQFALDAFPGVVTESSHLFLKNADLSLMVKTTPVRKLYTLWQEGYSTDIVTAFIDAGFCFTDVDRKGKTLRDMILLESLNSPDNLDKNLLFVDQSLIQLIKDNRIDKVTQLIYNDYNGIIAWDADGKSILDVVKSSGHTELENLFQNLLDLKEKIGSLFNAIEYGNLQGLKATLDESLSTVRTSAGQTLLHYAVLYDRKFIVVYLLENYYNLINCVDNYGRSALHYALTNDRNPFIPQLLIKAGIDQGIQDKNGVTAEFLVHQRPDFTSEMRQNKCGHYERILNNYVTIKRIIHEKDGTLLKFALKLMKPNDYAEMDQLPKYYPQFDWIPLLFVCVQERYEKAAINFIKIGADFNISYNSVTLLQAAHTAELNTLLKLIHDHRTATSIGGSGKSVTFSSYNGRSSHGSTSSPPAKKGGWDMIKDGKGKVKLRAVAAVTNKDSTTCILL